MDAYIKEIENKLTEMTKLKEESDRRLLKCEWVIGILACIVLFVPIFIGALLAMEDWQRIVIMFSGFAPAIIGFCVAMKIEQIWCNFLCNLL